MELDEIPINGLSSQGKTFEDLLEHELTKSSTKKLTKYKIEETNKNLNVTSSLNHEKINNVDINNREHIPKKSFLKRGEGKNAINSNIQTKPKNNYFEESTDQKTVNNSNKVIEPN